MNIKYTTWKSTTENRYLTQIEFGDTIIMTFFAATEAEAVARAESWYAAEKARQLKISGAATYLAEPSEKRTAIDPRPAVFGHGLKGMVWMVNRATHHLTRVAAGEIASFEQQGYIRGGPRSRK